MNYKVDINRELDLKQLSIANSELNCVLNILSKLCNEDVEKYIDYAKQLQSGLLNMEIELKQKLRSYENERTN